MSYTQITNSSLPIIISKLPNIKQISFAGCKITDEISISFRPIFSSHTKLEYFDLSDTPLTEIFLTTLASTPVSSSRSIPLMLSFDLSRCSKLVYPKKSAPFARDPKRPSMFLTKSLSFSNCLDLTDKMNVYLLYSLAPTYSAILTSLDFSGCSLENKFIYSKLKNKNNT